MFTLSDEISVMQKNKYFGPATVMDINEKEGLVLLRIESMGRDIRTWGRPAIPYPRKSICGETVLAAGEDINAVYIIGLLDGSSAEETVERRVTLKNGAYASVSVNDGAENFQLCSESGELIFEYDPETGKSRLNIQSGDLEFVTKNGNINFISEKDICFTSKQSIEMGSRYGIRLAIINAIGRVISSMSLNPGKVKLSGPELGITAQRGEIHIEDSKFIGSNFSGTFKHAKVIAGKLETLANDVIGRAKNVYKTVEELSQLKTGRMRILINSTFHIKAKRSYLKSEEDFKVIADKIHLG